MKFALSCLAALVTSPLLAAASVATGCYLAVPSGSMLDASTPQVGISQCSLNNGIADFASASAQISYSGAGHPGGWNTLHLVQSANASYQWRTSGNFAQGGGALTNVATASADYNQTFTTNGPVRQGYLQLSYSGYAGDLLYDGSEQLSIGITSINNASLTKFSCSRGQGCSFPAFVFYGGTLIPYTLGTSFQLSAQSSITAYSNVWDGVTGSQDDISYQFRFFEADGRTPVAVSSVPEPATGLLLSLPFVVALFAKRKQFSRPK